MDKQIDAMDSSLRFDMVLDNVRKLKPGLQLRYAAERLDELTENLSKIHCGEYCNNPRYSKDSPDYRGPSCKEAGICRTAMEEINAWTLFYKNRLEEMAEKHEEVPRKYSERFIRDVSKCLRVINDLGRDASTYVNGFGAHLTGRISIVQGLIER